MARRLTSIRPPSDMPRTALMLVGSLVLGLVAFAAIYYWQKQRIDLHHAHLSTFDWFCEAFDVPPEQRERLKALHHEHFPECEDHCVHYAGTRQTLEVITKDPKLDNSPEHEEAARRLAELERDADKQFIDFIYKIAAEMDPETSARYLSRMKGWLDRLDRVEGSDSVQ